MLKRSSKVTLLCALLITQKSLTNLTPLTFIPIPQLNTVIDPEADQKHKEKTLKERKIKRFLDSLYEADIPLLEESFEQAPPKLKAIICGMLNNAKVALGYKNILLTGPSGSGKSTLAQAIAYKLQRKCIVIHAPSLLGHFRDQAAENILKLFKEIDADPDEPVLVIDEINAFTDDHTSEHSDTKHTAMQLWTLIDKYSKDKGFLLIGTTNVSKKMPHQLQSRFEGKIFLIDNPSLEVRVRMLQFTFARLKIDLDPSCTASYLEELAQKIIGFSRRGIEAIINRALLISSMENFHETELLISKDNLEEAYNDLVHEREQFWDFREQTTDEERRHRENLEQNASHFAENQELQIKLAELSMLYQSFIKPLERNQTLDSNQLIKQLNLAKSIVFPNKSATTKFKNMPQSWLWGLRHYTEEVLDLENTSEVKV